MKRLISLLLCAAVVFGSAAVCRAETGIPENEETRFSVISDVHFLPREYVGSEKGYCYRRNMDNDLKLAAYSDEILDAALEQAVAAGSEYLIIPGDLAHSCQKEAHRQVAAKLAKLEARGVQVYVIPGNHDICPLVKDAKAVSFVAEDENSTTVYAGTEYVNDREVPVAGTSKDEFEQIYAGFGMGEGSDIIARAADSLSYVAQLGKVRLIAIDASYYTDDGFFTKEKGLDGERLAWVKKQIADCIAAGYTPVAMMHYDLVEKYGMQSLIMGNNFLDDGEKTAKQLADAGLRYIFTGHSHASDIACAVSRSGNEIYEICTGGLLLHGSPVRNISLGEKMEIKTVLLPEVEGIEDYQGYCKNLYYTDGVRTIMRNRGIFDASEAVAGALESDRFSYDSVFAFFVPLMTQVIDELLDMKLSGNVTLCDVLTEAYKQHYAGDEQYSPETAAAISQVKNGRAVAQALDIVFRALGDSISNGGFSGLRAALRAPFVNVLLFPLSQVLGVVLGSFLEGIFIDGAPGDNNVVL